MEFWSFFQPLLGASISFAVLRTAQRRFADLKWPQFQKSKILHLTFYFATSSHLFPSSIQSFDLSLLSYKPDREELGYSCVSTAEHTRTLHKVCNTTPPLKPFVTLKPPVSISSCVSLRVSTSVSLPVIPGSQYRHRKLTTATTPAMRPVSDTCQLSLLH